MQLLHALTVPPPHLIHVLRCYFAVLNILWSQESGLLSWFKPLSKLSLAARFVLVLSAHADSRQ